MKALRVPLLLFALPALLLAFAPARQDWFLLDRAALGPGQVWRLWSGHWVHFSGSHLAWNLLVLLTAGTWLERRNPGRLWHFTLVAAPSISLAILAGEAGLQRYGGLSALATGLVVWLALLELRQPGGTRWLWAGVLALVAIKTFHDTAPAGPWLADYGTSGIRTSRLAHAAGAGAGLLAYLSIRFGPGRSRADASAVQKPG